MAYGCIKLDNIVGFDWDDGNFYKNQKKHGILWWEIEEVFFNEPLLLLKDGKHSFDEERCYCLGQIDDGLELFMVFTKRNSKIRAISANSGVRALLFTYMASFVISLFKN